MLNNRHYSTFSGILSDKVKFLNIKLDPYIKTFTGELRAETLRSELRSRSPKANSPKPGCSSNMHQVRPKDKAKLSTLKVARL